MKQEIVFPKNLYSDVRIEERYSIWLNIQNGDINGDGEISEKGAMIRVYDGTMWYTSSTNDLDSIQKELDSLAELANPNPDIYEDPAISLLEVNHDRIFRYEGENDIRKITRDEWKELADDYVEKCIDDSIPEMNFWCAYANANHHVYSFYSSKGAKLEHDNQECSIGVAYGFTVDGVTTYGNKQYTRFRFEDLKHHEDEVLAQRDKVIDYARNAVDVEPGDYCCVLAPIVTAMFTHESFGHKSESDFMLNDKTLQEEWIIGKKVGSELVSICDDGGMSNHGYKPYDDEGTKAKETWLIQGGILTGRLHDANSASVLKETLTGNCRAQSYLHMPIVRMTNTYMKGGDTDPEKLLEGIEDGIYIDNVSSGTGQSMFTMRPTLCYRIRNGKKCEPLRVNVVNGNVFKTLFDIEAVGNDFELFDEYSCGKNGQGAAVSAGGPSIRVKSLTIN